MLPQSVSELDLHFGSHEADPTGFLDCDSCDTGVLPGGSVCPACAARLVLRYAWWRSSSGPEVQRARRLALEARRFALLLEPGVGRDEEPGGTDTEG